MAKSNHTDHPSNISNFVELLKWRVQNQPQQKAYTFLQDGKTELGSLTYQELDLQAKHVANKLLSLDMKGERALLLYPPGLEFIIAFFGCLSAQVIAVPLYPPRRNQNLSRLQDVVKDAGAKVALTNPSIFGNIEKHFSSTPSLASLNWLTSIEENIELEELKQHQPSLNENDLAFLQYTSGSTGKPKGVMVSHKNLLVNSQDLDLGWQHNSDSVIVTWLPTFHDMGLIYGVLQPLYKGIPCYMMAPVTFLQSPVRWLEAITNYRGTHSGAPNFAYELCLKKVTAEQKKSLDLSTWQMALNGAEPVRINVMKRFVEAFNCCGFSPSSFCPGYGLAEATLKVTAVRAQDKVKQLRIDSDELRKNQVVVTADNLANTQVIVGCGFTEIDTEIVIVNPHNLQKCNRDQVGEIWVSGSTVAQGYWQNQPKTQATFQAYLADTKEGQFLRTGDLGFIKEGELFVTGRLKDVIIIRGRNHYPQDIELTVEQSHEALIINHSAAFTIEVEGEDKLVIVSEVERRYRTRRNSQNNQYTGTERRNKQNERRNDELNPGFAKNLGYKPDLEEVVNCIRQEVIRNHGLQVYAIRLLRFASIPKTSSGKIQRHLCRQSFLDNSLNVVY